MAIIDDLDSVKFEIGLDSSETDYDNILNLLRVAAQSTFEDLTDRKFESAQFTEYYDAEKYCSKIFLRNYPVISIVSIHDDPDWEWGSGDLIDSTDYRCDLEKGIVHLDGYFSWGAQSVQVIYVAGYDKATLPEGIMQTWLRQIAHWYMDSKNSDWAIQAKTQPGGSVSRKELTDNLLPDFVMLSEVHRRRSFN